MQAKAKKNLLGLALVIFSVCPAAAGDILSKADSLRMAYRFAEAADTAAAALEKGADSLSVHNLKILSDNGLHMMNYVCEPEVIARKTVSADRFLLYCPFEDAAWKPAPNALDSVGGRAGQAVYAPEGREYVVFSAIDSTGHRSLWSTVVKEGVASEPVSVFDSLTAISNEIYPVLSNDGTKLYFASDGLYGAGGYDLYVSVLDPVSGIWGTPENLGFPFSSPADDFLYMDSDDGLFSAVVSNRSSSADSVCVFILKAEELPVRRMMEDPEEMRRIALLEPDAGEGVAAEQKDEGIPENNETLLYVSKMEQVKALRDSINNVTKILEQAQMNFASAPDEDAQASILESIREMEAGLPSLRATLDNAVKELQDIELDFLFKGVSLDPDKLMSKADRGDIAPQLKYEFPPKKFGDSNFVRIFAIPFEETRK